MQLPRQALDLVAPHCDIVERLEAVSPSARIRGIHLRILENELKHRGRLADYRALLPESRRSTLGWCPIREYLLCLACAGALAASPERVHEGMYDIMRKHAIEFTHSLIGRALLRLLARDPIRVSEQALAVQRQTKNYSQWELVRRGRNEIEMIYKKEYIWIESAIAGGAQGALEACDVVPIIETHLYDRFSGSTLIRW